MLKKSSIILMILLLTNCGMIHDAEKIEEQEISTVQNVPNIVKALEALSESLSGNEKNRVDNTSK